MPVEDGDLYRALIEHFERHARWRERLFEGYLIVLGALGGVLIRDFLEFRGFGD